MKNRMVFLGVGLAAFWWILESLVHVFIFHEGTLITYIFSPDIHEIWMRSLVACIIIAFGAYAEFDILQRKKAEEETKLAHGELDQIFNTAADGMRVVDKDFNVLRINETFSALSGVSRDEAAGKKCYEVFGGPQCNTPDCPMNLIFAGEKRVEHEAEKERKDGTKVPCIVTATPFCRPDGKLLGIVEDFKDITGRKRAEEELEKHRDHLEVLVEERTGELSLANEQLQKYAEELEYSNRLKDLFTDVMTHDLLNPAGAIKNASELLLEEETVPSERKLLEIIDWGVKKQMDMIESAGKLSRLKSAEDLKKESLDLNEVVDSAVEATRHLFEAAGMRLENRVAGPLPVNANPLIEDVFLNFLSNAAKYAADGEKVVIEALDEGGSYTVMVKDYGQGIPDEDKEGIFERFMRKAKKGVKGTGLGLTVAKRIVELHSGEVWIEDNPEGGSVFCVKLPK